MAPLAQVISLPMNASSLELDMPSSNLTVARSVRSTARGAAVTLSSAIAQLLLYRLVLLAVHVVNRLLRQNRLMPFSGSALVGNLRAGILLCKAAIDKTSRLPSRHCNAFAFVVRRYVRPHHHPNHLILGHMPPLNREIEKKGGRLNRPAAQGSQRPQRPLGRRRLDHAAEQRVRVNQSCRARA